LEYDHSSSVVGNVNVVYVLVALGNNERNLAWLHHQKSSGSENKK
jgi:hypothetical protein